MGVITIDPPWSYHEIKTELLDSVVKYLERVFSVREETEAGAEKMCDF